MTNDKQNNNIASFFTGKIANEYDLRASRTKPVMDAIYFSIYLILKDMKENSEIICVGAGTANEVIFLADKFPKYKFTCIEPAPEMVEIIKNKVKQHGIEGRVNIFNGYLNDFHNETKFDCALSLLVSHFFVDEEKRKNYFSEIKHYLKSDGILINADIAADMQSADFDRLLDIWVNFHMQSGLNAENVKDYVIDGMNKNYAVISPEKVQNILISAGFNKPVLFYRNILINAWVSSRE